MFNSLILGLFLACGEKEGDTASAGDADLANGESVYTATCLTCHPSSGDVPALSSSLTDEEMETIISSGSGGMPPQSSLSSQDIVDVVAYIRTIE
jgi:mono/diheme cytochrome c family protein